MAEYTLKDFDLLKAKNGSAVGYEDSKGIHPVISINFITSPIGTVGNVVLEDNKPRPFLKDGSVLSDDEEVIKLGIVETTITKTTGTRIVRETNSDGTANARQFPRISASVVTETSTQEEDDAVTGEVFSIATLQPREEIAMHCLEAMIQQYDNPIGIDNVRIKQLVSKSFLFAQEFINQGVLYREKETTSSTVESSKYASVDSDSLSSDTDKLLFNIATALTNMMAQSKNQYADQQAKGLKVNTADINVKTTFPDTINATISGSINAEVSGSVTTKQEEAKAENT